MTHVLDLLHGFLVHYGYWAVGAMLLLENAGIPLPGETILLLASFAAFSDHHLRLPYIIFVGVVAASVGDNIGFAIGHYGGRRLLARYGHVLHISPRTIRRGELLFRRYGAFAVFFARFVAGLRIVAGPLAGVLRMRWKPFVLFNFMGAALWVTVISVTGYLFGRHWDLLLRYSKRLDFVTATLILVLILVLWHRHKRGELPK